MSNEKKEQKLSLSILKKCILPLISIIILGFFYGTYLRGIKASIKFDTTELADKGFFILAVIIATYWARVILYVVFKWYTEKALNRDTLLISKEFLPLIKRVLNLLLWIIALTIVLSYLGINITGLIATLGVASLAISLAAQDTIANIIAGFLIMIDRPFSVNDEIKIPTGERVKVIHIGIRRSRFRAEDNSTIIVPNVDLSKSKIVNYSKC